MEFRTRYNYGSNKPYHYHSEQVSLTDQRYAKDTDLSRIVGIDGGQLYIKDQQAFINAANANDFKDDFQDVSDIKDLATVHRTMADAQNRFNDLPSAVRAKYDNDLVKFISAFDNDKIIDKSSSIAPVEGAQNADNVVEKQSGGTPPPESA